MPNFQCHVRVLSVQQKVLSVQQKCFHSQLLPHKHHKNSKQGHCFGAIALDYQDHCHGKSPGRWGRRGISQNACWKPEPSLLSQKQRDQRQREGYVPPSQFVFWWLKSSIACVHNLYGLLSIHHAYQSWISDMRYGTSLGGPKTLKTLHFKIFFDVQFQSIFKVIID